MRKSWFSTISPGWLAACSLCLSLLAAPLAAQRAEVPGLESADTFETLDGLDRPVAVVRDGEGIAHVFAATDHDATFMLGWVHAEDRFFQMDSLRRTLDGTLAELAGTSALGSDVQLRAFHLERAAEASYAVASPSTRAWAEAYAEGINAWLATNPLPLEYDLLELTHASVRPWQALDVFLFMKGLVLLTWLDFGDLDRTLAFDAFGQAGAAGGFDGAALFFEDVFRAAPIEAEVTVAGGLERLPGAAGSRSGAPAASRFAASPAAAFALEPPVLERARQLRDEIAANPVLRPTLEVAQNGKGSNFWAVSGRLTESGRPLFANDGHQFLAMPSGVYEAHLLVAGGARLNLQGKTFPGLPLVISGCNARLCWGATNNALDVSDIFQEQLVLDPASGEPTHSLLRGELKPVVAVEQAFRANVPGDGELDNVVPVPVPPGEGGRSFFLPHRNNGPLLFFVPTAPEQGFGMSIQFTGFAATEDLEGFRQLQKAHNLATFEKAIRHGDSAVFNFGFADFRGNIAYYTMGEMPLREDLELLGQVEGLPPFLVRDGTGQLRNEWLPVQRPQPFQALPYEILSFDEMPQARNPAEGFLINANNDPLGTSVDNDPFNERRATGGVLYFNRAFSNGLRAAKIRRLLEEETAGGRRVSSAEVAAIQSNVELEDAEILLPHLFAAFDHADDPGAPPELAALGTDPGVAEAITRLAAWNLTTPTGIPQGYDPGDDPDDLPAPGAQEIANSVATTLYSTWRSEAVRDVVDSTLAAAGLGLVAVPDRQALVALVHHLESFPASGGVGASGLDFFAVPGVADPMAARDVLLLRSLRDALDLLASSAFAAAFGGSTDQDDYRWGLVHRIELRHPLGGPFNVPGSGGFVAVDADLPGVAKAGGFDTVDVAANRVRVSGENDFMFTLAPGGRLVATPRLGAVDARQILPGGNGGDPFEPLYTNQLGRWLTNGYAPVAFRPLEVLLAGEETTVFFPER